MSDDVFERDAVGQAEAVRRGDVTPAELVEAAINRIEKLNPTLNAVIHPLFDKARLAASRPLPDGALRGVPMLLKDLMARSEGDPYYYGTRFLRDAGWVSPDDAELTRRFRRAGCVVVGRTNAPELGAWTTTEPDSYGPTRNPWDTARSTGGSSGGSAAAVASGMVPFAHANDGGGSIRIPASECGLVGLKPTRGRTSLAPDHGESWEGMVVELAVTRSVRDTAAVLDAVSGMAPGDPYAAPAPSRPFAEEVGADPGSLRIGVMRRLPVGAIGSTLHPDCLAAVDATAAVLEELGHRLTEAHPAALDEATLSDAAVTVIAAAQARDLEFWGEQIGRAITADDVDSDNWAVAEMGRQVTATAYLAAVEQLHAWTRRLAMWWAGADAGGEGFDVLLTPTIPEPPPPLGELVPRPDQPLAGFMRSSQLVAYTIPFNISGQPAISLPLQSNAAGLPIGIQLAGEYGREDLLLRLAAQLEQARPWRDRHPPVHA